MYYNYYRVVCFLCGDKMRRKSKKNYILLIIFILFGVSAGYAVINRTLNITGNTEITKNTWDIYFDNVKVKAGSVTSNLPVIDTTTKATVNFNTVLNLPGEYYEFSIDVVNSGTIDAMIESIIKTPELTTEQEKYLNYIIEYQNREQITSKQLVEKDSFVRIRVRVEYRKDITEFELPITSQSLNLGFSLNYVQADSIGTSVKDNGVFDITANGSLDELGTIVTIGTEQFYTIGTEGDNVKLLSMYNLYVGNKCTGDTNDSCTPYGEEATGMQDERMAGYSLEPGLTEKHGTVEFSNASQKGMKNSDYRGSLVEIYVNNYKTLLEKKYGLDVIEARLIMLEELTSEEIGCDEEAWNCSKNAPYWIYYS